MRYDVVLRLFRPLEQQRQQQQQQQQKKHKQRPTSRPPQHPFVLLLLLLLLQLNSLVRADKRRLKQRLHYYAETVAAGAADAHLSLEAFVLQELRRLKGHLIFVPGQEQQKQQQQSPGDGVNLQVQRYFDLQIHRTFNTSGYNHTCHKLNSLATERCVAVNVHLLSLSYWCC